MLRQGNIIWGKRSPKQIEYELIDRNYITRNFTSIVRDMIQKHMNMTHGYGTVQHRNKSY